MGRVDTVLRGGTVLDGSGAKPILADVAIAGGRIADVRESIPDSGRTEIDVAGRVVCPGFVDVHAHDDLAAVMPDGLEPKYAQGVTSALVGNCGHGVAPSGAYGQQIRSYSAPVLGPGPQAWPWPDFRSYLRELRRAEPPIRVHSLAPHGVARMSVMGFEARAASPSEEKAIVTAIGESLNAGAVGVSFGLMYAPACFAARSELVAIAREAAGRDAVLAVHLRAEGAYILESLSELYEIAVESGVSLHISHLKCSGSSNHGRMVEVVRELDRWRGQGISVTADVYPYTAGSTTICGMLPEFALEGGVDQLLAKLDDTYFRTKVADALAKPWERLENHLLACGGDNIVLTGLRQPDNRRYEGCSVGDIARDRGLSAEMTLVEIVRQEDGRAGVIQHQGSEQDLIAALSWPHTMVGSDGLPAAPGDRPHPRLFGTFPRVLNRYAGDGGCLTLEDAVARMTSMPARRFGLADVGLLMPGAHADVVVFDPETVADLATYDEPRRHPSGIDQVWSGGQPVIPGPGRS